MTFATQFKDHFAEARAQVSRDFAAIDVKAEREVAELEKIVGPITGPLSAKALEDAFEKAAHASVGTGEIASLLSAFVRGSIDFERIVGPVNDKTQLLELLTEARGEIAKLDQGLRSPAALDEVISAIPHGITAGRTQADIKLIATEVRDYALAVLSEVARRVEAVAAKCDTHRDRAIGLTQVRQVSEHFRDFRSEQQAFAPLRTFDFSQTIELADKTRSDYPALASAFDASQAKDLPDEILVKSSLGLHFEADKSDPDALNQAAWATFADASATADKLKTALRISMFSVRLTGAQQAMQLDTAACLAARLGLAELARDCNAAAKAISPDAAQDSTEYLAAIASGAAKPIATVAEIAATYPMLVASCEAARFEVPAEPVMLPGVLGMQYQADFGDVDHLNRMAWGAYESSDAEVSKDDLARARDMAAVGCRLSQYTHAAILDTYACLEHRLGNLQPGREAAKRAAELDPAKAGDSAALYA